MSYLTLSIMGLYTVRPDILDNETFLLPVGVDRDTVNALILAEAAELEVLYPNPDTMAAVVKAWSTARKPSWERMLTALSEDYNPLHNYDRHETEEYSDAGTETEGGTVTRRKTGAETNAKTGTDRFDGQNTTQGQSVASVAGYNSTSLANRDQTTNTGGGTDTGTTTHNTTDTLTHNTTDAESRDISRERESAGGKTLHAYGNIGVTTSAQMLVGELEVRQIDIYHIISREFIRRFCLLVY